MNRTISESKVIDLLEAACGEANNRLIAHGVLYSEDSRKNEDFVVRVLKDVAPSVGIDAEAISHLGGKAFPDVHILNSPFGIELKGSKRGGVITGNSIFSGAMVDGLQKIFLLYWIDDREPKIGFRDYFDCVFDAKVTHSPRFALQIDLEPSDRMFGSKRHQLGFVAADWLKGDKKYVDLIVREIRRRALERDEIPWWVLSDSSEGIAVDVDTNDGLGGLRYLNNVDRDASFSLQKTLFMGFPEVLSGGKAAHSLAVGWAISQRSTIIGRDVFSAGGQQTIHFGGRLGSLKLPAVIGKCALALARPATVSLRELSSIHGRNLPNAQSAIKRFGSKLRQSNSLTYLADYQNGSGRRRLSENDVQEAVIDFLIQQIDESSFR